MELVNRVITGLSAVIDTSEVNIPKPALNDSALQEVLSIIFALIGGISLLFIIYGGIRLIMSQGNPDAFNKARNIILYAIVGLVISVSAFSIVTFVVGRV